MTTPDDTDDTSTTHFANEVIAEGRSLRFYIAGCVTDGGRIKEKEYSRKFAEAEDAVRGMGHHPVNPTTLDHNHQRRWQDYMVEALHAMLDCDGVYALPCWRKSKGATIEVQLAIRLGKQVIFQSDLNEQRIR